MTTTRRKPATTEQAADAGFPVEVRLPVGDGPLVITDPFHGTAANYDVTGGIATASSRARLDQLVAIGGTPVISTPSPQGQGSESPESPDGDTSA